MLVVDDNEFFRSAVERMLARAGYSVTTVRDGADAMAVVSAQPVDLVLCDVKMPGISGHELVRQVHEVNPDLPCIVMTGYDSVEHSVEALRSGAFWYLHKPFEGSLDVVRRLVEQAIEHRRLRTENRMLHSQLRSRYRFDNIVGQSAALRGVLDLVDKVADSGVQRDGGVAQVIRASEPSRGRLLARPASGCSACCRRPSRCRSPSGRRCGGTRRRRVARRRGACLQGVRGCRSGRNACGAAWGSSAGGGRARHPGGGRTRCSGRWFRG